MVPGFQNIQKIENRCKIRPFRAKLRGFSNDENQGKSRKIEELPILAKFGPKYGRVVPKSQNAKNDPWGVYLRLGKFGGKKISIVRNIAILNFRNPL